MLLCSFALGQKGECIHLQKHRASFRLRWIQEHECAPPPLPPSPPSSPSFLPLLLSLFPLPPPLSLLLFAPPFPSPLPSSSSPFYNLLVLKFMFPFMNFLLRPALSF